MLVMQVRDTSPAMDCSKLDHDGGADGEHRHHPGVSVPLPLGHRDGSLVDHLLRRPRALYLPDPGRHRREAGEAHQDQQPPGGAVWPRVWQPQHSVCQHRQQLRRETRHLSWLDAVPGSDRVTLRWPDLTCLLSSVCVPPPCSTAPTGRPTSRGPSPSALSMWRRDRSSSWPSCSSRHLRASLTWTSGPQVWVWYSENCESVPDSKSSAL